MPGPGEGLAPVPAPPMATGIEQGLAPDARILGQEFLTGLGLNALSVGVVILDGGRPGCTGTLDDFLGTADHGRYREQAKTVVERAIANGEDPETALINGLGFFVMRDAATNEPLRAAPLETSADVKKN